MPDQPIPAEAMDAAKRACTCTNARFTYATTHSVYCALSVGDAERRAIIEAAAPALRAQGAEAERERIRQAGGISACCGATFTRPEGRYSKWICDECQQVCDLIGVIA